MKNKLVLIILLLFVSTGCESTIKYNFNDNIESNVNLNFTMNEYKEFTNVYYGNDYGYQSNDILIQSLNNNKNNLYAFINYNNSIKYNLIDYSSNNEQYIAKYKYTYNYSNFKDNYILNYCFETFEINEDADMYQVFAMGRSNCIGAKIIIEANNRMIKHNATNVNNDEYIWNINEANNDISFTLSKFPITNNSNNILMFVFLGIAILIGILAYFLNKKINRKNINY